MDHLHSDVPGDESPHCAVCEKQIGVLTDAIALRIGVIKQERRERFDFYDDFAFDDGEEIKWFHFSCLEDFVDFTQIEDVDHTECGLCPEDLLGEASCYELELGHFELNGDDTWWVESRDGDGNHVRVCLCRECLENQLGVRDEEEAGRILGQVA